MKMGFRAQEDSPPPWTGYLKCISLYGNRAATSEDGSSYSISRPPDGKEPLPYQNKHVRA